MSKVLKILNYYSSRLQVDTNQKIYCLRGKEDTLGFVSAGNNIQALFYLFLIESIINLDLRLTVVGETPSGLLDEKLAEVIDFVFDEKYRHTGVENDDICQSLTIDNMSDEIIANLLVNVFGNWRTDQLRIITPDASTNPPTHISIWSRPINDHHQIINNIKKLALF